MMRSDKAQRKLSGPLLVFLAVYIAAFGLLLAPKGTFVQASLVATAP